MSTSQETCDVSTGVKRYIKLKFITSCDCIVYGRLNVAIFCFVNIFISVNHLTEPGEIILKWFCLSWRASFSLSKFFLRRLLLKFFVSHVFSGMKCFV